MLVSAGFNVSRYLKVGRIQIIALHHMEFQEGEPLLEGWGGVRGGGGSQVP